MSLPAALGARRDLPGGPEGRARRNAREDSLAPGEFARRRPGVLGTRQDDLIDERRVVDAGYEARADALDLVGAGLGRPRARARLGAQRRRP